MSKYTAVRRSGGGLLTSQIVNTMTLAAVEGGIQLIITYARQMSIATLGASSFVTGPTGETGVTMTQLSPTTIKVNFTGDVETEITLTYTGNAAAFTSPQVIGIT